MSTQMTRVENLLNQYVAYNQDYASKQDNGYNIFKKTLNEHLQGERGRSLIGLIFSRKTFASEEVRLGLTPSCPMPLRQQIIAQHNYLANKKNGSPVNEDGIRVTNLVSSILGMPLSLTYRIIRTVLRSLFLPLTYLYALHQQNRYGIEGWAEEDVRRISWEWIDSAITLMTFFTGLVNFFHPNAIKLDRLRDYYIRRTDQAIDRNIQFADKKKTYLETRAQIRQMDKSAQSVLHSAYPSQNQV